MKEWWRQIYSASYGDATHLDSLSLGEKLGEYFTNYHWQNKTHFQKKETLFMNLLGQCRCGLSNGYVQNCDDLRKFQMATTGISIR